MVANDGGAAEHAPAVGLLMLVEEPPDALWQKGVGHLTAAGGGEAFAARVACAVARL